MGWPGGCGNCGAVKAGKGTGGRVSFGAGGDRNASHWRDRLSLSHHPRLWSPARERLRVRAPAGPEWVGVRACVRPPAGGEATLASRTSRWNPAREGSRRSRPGGPPALWPGQCAPGSVRVTRRWPSVAYLGWVGDARGLVRGSPSFLVAGPPELSPGVRASRAQLTARQ